MTRTDRLVSMFAVVVAGILLTFDIGCHLDPAEEASGKPPAEACDPAVTENPSPSSVGQAANLALTLKDMDGKDILLSSYKGKVILINFWATWCAPCKAEIPHFVDLQKTYAEDLQVLGISVDDTPKDVKPYAAQYRMNYPVLIGLNRDDVDKAYGPFLGIPQTFIIARDGTICRKHAGIATKEKFEQEIKALL